MLTKQLFPLTNDKSWRSLLIRDGNLYLINQNYKTDDDFWEGYQKKGLLKKKKEVVIANISKLAHPEKNGRRLDVVASDGKFFMDFANENDLMEVTDYLQKERRLTATTNTVSTFKAISPSLIGLGLTALFTYVIYQDALVLEDGYTIDTSGRRSLFKLLFAWLAEKLGSQGTLIAGGVIGVICLYFLFKAMRNPPNEVVYE